MAFDKPDAPTMRDPDAPQWVTEEHIGDLLVVQVQEIKRDAETEYGAKPVIVADVHVITPAGTIGASYESTWLFGTVLFSQLSHKRGRTVLGVLEQGEKKPGKKPPWRLADASDVQEALALRAMASKPDAPQESDTWGAAGERATPQPATASAGAADGKAPWE
jgi:hypothetical protein